MASDKSESKKWERQFPELRRQLREERYKREWLFRDELERLRSDEVEQRRGALARYLADDARMVAWFTYLALLPRNLFFRDLIQQLEVEIKYLAAELIRHPLAKDLGPPNGNFLAWAVETIKQSEQWKRLLELINTGYDARRRDWGRFADLRYNKPPALAAPPSRSAYAQGISPSNTPTKLRPVLRALNGHSLEKASNKERLDAYYELYPSQSQTKIVERIAKRIDRSVRTVYAWAARPPGKRRTINRADATDQLIRGMIDPELSVILGSTSPEQP